VVDHVVGRVDAEFPGANLEEVLPGARPCFTAVSTAPANELMGMLPAPVLVAYSAMCFVALGTTEKFSPATERSKLSGT